MRMVLDGREVVDLKWASMLIRLLSSQRQGLKLRNSQFRECPFRRPRAEARRRNSISGEMHCWTSSEVAITPAKT